jgi:hypothetical protein
MTRIYVVQETEHNILPAQKHGEIFVVFTFRDVAQGPSHMLTKLDRVMQRIKPTDCILCIGDPLAIGLTIYAALERTNGRISVLRWNKQHYEYEKEEIVII